MAIQTSNDIKTMHNARTINSISKSLGGVKRSSDNTRLLKNESILKKRILRKGNRELRSRINQIEKILTIKGK